MTRGEARAFLDWLRVLIPRGAPDVVTEELITRWEGHLTKVDPGEAHAAAVDLADRWRRSRWPMPPEFSEVLRVRSERATKASAVAAARELIRNANPGPEIRFRPPVVPHRRPPR